MRQMLFSSPRALALGCLLCIAGCPSDPPPTGTDAGMEIDAPVVMVDAPMAPPDTPPVDAPTGPPVFRNPVDMPDNQLAISALGILGSGSSFACAECHGLTRARFRDWLALSMTSLDTCLTSLDAPTPAQSQAMLDCLRAASPDGTFRPASMGVFATAAGLPWFRYVFEQAYGTGWSAEHEAFLSDAGMPPLGRTPLTQDTFDIVAEWVIRGMPLLDTLVPDGSTTTCTPMIDPAVATYVADRATTGWRSVNAGSGLLMFGCAGAATPLECLASEPLASATSYGASWDDVPGVPGSRMRVLYETSYRSSFWTRSSADGRFVGHGGGPAGASIIDLLGDRVIGVSASYDPGFFPDNSGFMMLGGGGICETRVLTTGTPTLIDFSEPGCTSSAMVGLYEHLGASLGGGDYWAVHGQFVSDNGGHSFTGGDPAATFDAMTRTRLTRLVNTGSGFSGVETLSVGTPSEGDAVISPSNGLVVTRLAGMGGQLGFVLRRVDATNTSGTWTLDMPTIARYCMTGGKPAFSYDERWLVYHHYFSNSDADAIELGFTGASDPGFAAYLAQGAANVYLLDLLTGSTVRITNMAPGQYALYPHFRSDGWIYFLVRYPGSSTETVVASDAALLLE